MTASGSGAIEQDGGGMFVRRQRPWDVFDLIQRYPDGNGSGGNGGSGTEVIEPVQAVEPEGSTLPPTRTSPPEQKFSKNDLDTAASTARYEERERIKNKHVRDLEQKDEKIAQLQQALDAANEVIDAFDRDTRESYVKVKETLPPLIAPFAPEEDAPISEIRAFLSRMRKATVDEGIEDPGNPAPPAPPAPPMPPSPPPAPAQVHGQYSIEADIAHRRATGGRKF